MNEMSKNNLVYITNIITKFRGSCVDLNLEILRVITVEDVVVIKAFCLPFYSSGYDNAYKWVQHFEYGKIKNIL
jgi:hypothetical protein